MEGYFIFLFLCCFIFARSAEIEGKIFEREGYINHQIIASDEDNFLHFFQNGIGVFLEQHDSEKTLQEFSIFQNELVTDFDVSGVFWQEQEKKILIVIAYDENEEHKMIIKRLNIHANNTFSTTEIAIDSSVFNSYISPTTRLVVNPSIIFIKQVNDVSSFYFVWENINAEQSGSEYCGYWFVMDLKENDLINRFNPSPLLEETKSHPIFPVIAVGKDFSILSRVYTCSEQYCIKSYVYENINFVKKSGGIYHDFNENTEIYGKLKTKGKENTFAITWGTNDCEATGLIYEINATDAVITSTNFFYENAINPDISMVFNKDNIIKGFFLSYQTMLEENQNDISVVFQDITDFHSSTSLLSYQSPKGNQYQHSSVVPQFNDNGELTEMYIFFESNDTTTISVKEEFGTLCPKGKYFTEFIDAIGIAVCEECTEDTYKNTEGNEESCTACPPTSTTDGIIGATSEDQCLCPVNFYKDSNSCKTCPSSSSTNEEIGKTSIDGCICDEGSSMFGGNCVDSMTIGLLFASGGIIASLIIGFFVAFIIFLIIFFVCIGKFKKKANRFDHIEGVDMILKEAELDQLDKAGPTIKVKQSNYIIEYKDIKIIKKIGQGASSSVVYLADWKGIQCAFKGFSEGSSLVGNDDCTFDEFEKEVAVCVQLSHPSILQFYGASITPRRIGLLIQYCVNGDLNSFLKTKRKKLDEGYPINEKIRILQEIVSGMEYLHGRKLVHRDLKPENILLDENEKVKIMDFGLSKTIDNADKTMTKMIGTVFYMSPEVIEGINYSFPCDVYSFGIMAYVIITENFFPYGKKISQPAIMGKVSIDPSYRPEIKEEEFKECQFLIPIIQKCWSFKPEERYSFTELKKMLEIGKKRIKNEKANHK